MKTEYHREMLGVPFEESEETKLLRSLAKEYHDRTEAYDRRLCTGPIVHGRVVPMGPFEHSACSRNAMAIRAELRTRIPRELWIKLSREISDYRKTL